MLERNLKAYRFHDDNCRPFDVVAVDFDEARRSARVAVGRRNNAHYGGTSCSMPGVKAHPLRQPIPVDPWLTSGAR